MRYTAISTSVQNTVHMIQVFDSGTIEHVDNVREACIKSVIAHGHNVQIWLHKKSDAEHFKKLYSTDITDYVTVRYCDVLDSYVSNLSTARSLYGGKRGYEKFNGRLAPYTDLLRYEILQKHGGWWLDDDVILLKNLSSLVDEQTSFKCATEYNWFSSYSRPIIPSNYCIYSSIQSAEICSVRNTCDTILSTTEIQHRSYVEFGPLLFRRLFDNYSAWENNLFEPHVVYSPYNIDTLGMVHGAITVDKLLPMYTSHGLHLTGLIEHIDEHISSTSIVGCLLNMINTNTIPTFDRLYAALKHTNEKLFNTLNIIKQKRLAYGNFDNIDWASIKHLL